MQLWVARVARRVVGRERAPGQVHRRAVGRLDHAIGRHRDDVAVHGGGRLDAVYVARRRHQLRRIDHVAGAARMHDELRVRGLRHQQAGAARVVEVHVGQHDVVDDLGTEALVGERREHVGDGIVGPAVDDGDASLLDDDVDRVQLRPDVTRVDGADAVRIVDDGRGHGGRRCRDEGRIMPRIDTSAASSSSGPSASSCGSGCS